MALFSRRKKSDSPADSPEVPVASAEPSQDQAAAQTTPAEDVPAVNISVQAFRGVGAQAGGAVSLESDAEAPAPAAPAAPQPAAPAAPAAAPAAADRPLPLAPLVPPTPSQTVVGVNDNVLLREALARLPEKPTNEQLLGVLRQGLQGNLLLRVHGDAKEQLAQGKPLSVGVVRDGDRSFLLAFSSGEALRRTLAQEAEPKDSAAVAQSVTAVIHQVIGGGFTGLILDNASAPHRAVLPTEVLKKALDDADPEMRIKAILAAPRQPDTEAKLAELLGSVRVWVGAGTGPTGQIGIAEAKTADGKRYLQAFSHPLEVVALGRGERPVPFTPEQLGRLLREQADMAGVLLDPAGPTMVVRRDALSDLIVAAGEAPASPEQVG